MRVWFAAGQGALEEPQTFLLSLATAAAGMGYDVGVIAPHSPAAVLRHARAQGLRTVQIKGGRALTYATNLAVWDLAERHGDLVWCDGLVPAYATLGHRRRVVHLDRAPGSRLSRLGLRAVTGGTTTLVVPTQALAQQVPHAHVLGPWTPAAGAYDPARTLPCDRDVVRVGFLGRPGADGGLPDLLTALTSLARDEPGRYELVLPETPDLSDAERDRLSQVLSTTPVAVSSTGVHGRTFLGEIDLACWCPTVDPGTADPVIQAMSAGCPVVVARTPAALDAVGPDHRFCCTPGDPQSLAETITAAVSSYGRADLDLARARWEDEFSPTAGRDRLRDILESLGAHAQ